MAVVSAAILGAWNLGAYDLWAPDEPYFGEGAREMVVDGQWAVPHVNGVVTSDKPPLFFWLIAVFSLPFGAVSSFTARLPSLLAGIGAGLGGFLGHGIIHAAYIKPSDVEGERILVDDGSPRWRRYPVELLDKVFMKWCLVGANEIHLQLIGQKNHLYGLGDRGQTKACREKLRELFPEVYTEKGFDKLS